MKTVEIYTDGACIGNPGPGGWAADHGGVTVDIIKQYIQSQGEKDGK